MMWHMSLFARAAATLAAAAVVLAPSSIGTAHATTPDNLPHADPFYRYNLDGTPGTPPAASIGPAYCKKPSSRPTAVTRRWSLMPAAVAKAPKVA